MLKLVRTLFICFCLIGIWSSCLYFNVSSTPVSSIEKLSPAQTESHSFQVFEQIEWEEDFNDELTRESVGAIPSPFYFYRTTALNYKVKAQLFKRIRGFFPPLYLRHCTYRI